MARTLSLTEKETNELIEIFKINRLPIRSSINLAKWAQHTELHKGLPFLVSYMKAVKSYLLKGVKPDFRFRIDKRGRLSGPLKPVQKLAEGGRRGLVRACRILNTYGRWEHDQPVREDYVTFKASVELDHDVFPLDLRITKEEKLLAKDAESRSHLDLALPMSDTKKVPFLRLPESDVLPVEHFRALQEYAPAVYLRNRSMFDRLYKLYEILAKEKDNMLDYRFLPDAAEERFYQSTGNVGLKLEDCKLDLVGRVVGLTKDRGNKLRFIANPHRYIQVALSRLKASCERYLKSLPESCVYNQEEGPRWGVEVLQKGGQLWSVDLKSATDLFPFELQEQLMRKLFPNLRPDINLWRDVVHASWGTPYDDVTVSYSRGQPMGTAPSFAAFTITHIHLIRMLGGSVDNFRVLGDDVLISDQQLAEDYIEMLELLGVKVSEMKSFYGGHFGEFAGRLFDKYGILPIYKAAPRSLSLDPLGYVRQYGLKGLGLFTQKELPRGPREAILFFAQMPWIGPEHLWNVELFDSLTVEQVKLIYSPVRERLYPKPSPVVPRKWLLEGSVPRDIVMEPEGEGLGNQCTTEIRNNPLVADHVNTIIMDLSKEDNSSLREFKDFLAQELQHGGSAPFGTELKLPLRWITRTYRRAMKGSL